jgi:hypothetical protein
MQKDRQAPAFLSSIDMGEFGPSGVKNGHTAVASAKKRQPRADFMSSSP